VATASRWLTRRFGIVGGLSLVALLALVEGGEIAGAVRDAVSPPPPPSGETVTLPSGVAYTDVKLGVQSSSPPAKGDFVGLHLRVTPLADPDGEPLLDTRARGRPLAFTYGNPLPAGAICRGLVEGLEGMKRGGEREVVLPPGLGPYGGRGGAPLYVGGPRVAPGLELRYLVSLEEVSPGYL